MGSRTWADIDLEALKTLWPKGYTGAEICAALGNRYSRNGVIAMANRLIAKNLLTPREANNKAWREKSKAEGKPYHHKTKPRLSKPFPFKTPDLKSEPLPKPRADDIAPIGPIGEFEAGMTTCRWPFETAGVIQWCGHPGFPWCSHHKLVAWSKPYVARP